MLRRGQEASLNYFLEKVRWSVKATNLQKLADKDQKVFDEQENRWFVVSSEGQTLFTEKKYIILGWKEHFEVALNSPTVIDDDVIASFPQRHETPTVVTSKKVQDFIRLVFLGKVSGKDDKQSEVF